MIPATSYPPRPSGQRHVLGLACPALDTVRVGMIGLGVRAIRAVERFMHLEGTRLVALCDIVPQNVCQARKVMASHGYPEARTYTGSSSWRELCEAEDIDLIYICTDWESHAPMAVYAMECGKHAAVEVPAATTVEQCWKLVDTAERMRRHCMMLENACYDEFELTTLNMIHEGLFGEIIHAEGAYIHDLRERIFSNEHGRRRSDFWQLKYNMEHTGNPYPTHGLGPVCQAMGIHRGDRMSRLVSLSTRSVGMNLYAAEKYGPNYPGAKCSYRLGDMNSTLIGTERGRTIMLQYNISSPRPYSRIHLLNGTLGFACKYPIPQMAFFPDSDKTLDSQQIEALLHKYEHPILRQVGPRAQEICGERARDFIMDWRLIHCLRHGLPLDQDVYDAAEWSCLVELTELSVSAGGEPVEIPDFTRGDWNLLDSLDFAV